MPDNELRVDVKTSGGDALDRIASSVDAIEKALTKATPALSEHEKAIKKAEDAAAHASEKVKDFGETIKAHLENPVSAATGTLKTFAEGFGLAGTAMAVGVGVIAAAGVAAFEAAHSLGELGTQINAIAVRTGLSTKEVGQFGFAAKAAGSDISSFEVAMKQLSRGLSENSEEGKKAKAAMAALHIETRDINGDLRPMSEIFLDIGEALGKMSSTAERNTSALAMLGRSGLELLPTLIKLRENFDDARKAGVGMTEEQVAHLEEYHKRVLLIEVAWDRAWRKAKTYFVDVASWLVDKGSTGQAPAGAGGAGGTSGFGSPAGMSGLAAATANQKYTLDPSDLQAAYARVVPGGPEGDFSPTGQRNLQGKRNLARVGADQAYYNFSASGIQANLERSTGLQESSREAYFAAAGDKTKSDAQVEALRLAWVNAASAVRMYQGQVDAAKAAADALKQVEAERFATLQQYLNAYQKLLTPQSAIIAERDEMLAGTNDPEARANIQKTYEVKRAVEIKRLQKQGLGFGAAAGADIAAEDSRRLAFNTKQFQTTLKEGIGADEVDQGEDFQKLGAYAKRDEGLARGASSQRLRLAELGRIGPGNEGAGIQQAYKEALALAQQIREIQRQAGENDVERVKHTADLELAIDEARRQRELGIAEIRKQAREADRAEAGNLFDALRGGSKGLQQYASNLAMGQARMMFQNVVTPTMTQIRHGLSTGGDGPGGIFKGTLLGRTPEQVATDANTTATIANTAALMTRTTGLGIGPGGVTGGGALGGIPGIVASGGGNIGGDVLNALGGPGSRAAADVLASGYGAGLDGGGSTGGGLSAFKTLTRQFGAGVTSVGSGYAINRVLTPAGRSVQVGDGVADVNTNAARVGAGIGLATAGYEGVKGVIGGLKQGGGRGFSSAIAAGAATAAAFDPEPISHAILQGVALAGTIAKDLFGDPKAERAKDLENLVRTQHYFEPQSVALDQDMSGRNVDHDFRGRLRSSDSTAFPNVTDPRFAQSSYDSSQYSLRPGSVTPNFTVNIQALDGDSVAAVLDRHGPAIADSLYRQVQLGHPVVGALDTSINRQ